MEAFGGRFLLMGPYLAACACVFFLGRTVARFYFIAYLDPICIPRAVVLFQSRAEVGVLSFTVH